MDKLITLVNRLLRRDTTPPALLPQGMYHYQSPADANPQYRMHLRVEPDGTGLLIINAHTTLHLNQTATEYAFYLVNDASENTILNTMKSRYQASDMMIKQDMSDFKATILRLAQSEDLDPVTYFGFDRKDPYTTNISAPYRLDCALTYRMSEETAQSAAPVERVKREMLTEEWSKLLENAWQAGIPHVIFTGGEPTLRPDLPDIIASAEKLGQVTGLLTDGYRLANSEYFHSLLNAGLDHLLLVLDPKEEQSWEAVRDAINEDIFVTVHLTISENITVQAGRDFGSITTHGYQEHFSQHKQSGIGNTSQRDCRLRSPNWFIFGMGSPSSIFGPKSYQSGNKKRKDHRRCWQSMVVCRTRW